MVTAPSCSTQRISEEASPEHSALRFLARTTAAKAYEAGLLERTVLIEFDSVEQAAAVHDSAAYQAALAALGDGVVRDLRIVPGV